MTEERREEILRILGEAASPVSGSSLSEKLGVSRQVIVQDVAILRAAGRDIVATSRGYLLPGAEDGKRAVLAVQHGLEETEKELNIMVDSGLLVINVSVEHAIYGELTGNLMLKSRLDVREFMRKLERERASLLSSLTGGFHLHTVGYEREEQVDWARERLREEGILVEDE